MQVEHSKMLIGSYPYRGTVNLSRMLCQYLNLPYQNIFFNPCSWKIYKQKNTENWHFQELPFLMDESLIITQPFPMCQYIIKKSGDLSLLGKDIDDELVVDNFLWGKDMIQNLLSIVVENKNNPKKLMEEVHGSWMKTVRYQLLQYQKNAMEGEFYLGYLTVIDFMIHEIIEYHKNLFHSEMYLFPKLIAIRQKVAALPKIQNLQASNKLIIDLCPLQFYRKWKTEALRARINSDFRPVQV